MRLIDACKLQNEYKNRHDGKRLLLIDVAPTVDAVPVCRCAMCRFYEDAEYDGCTKSVCRLIGRQMQDDDYCSYGERKGGNE